MKDAYDQRKWPREGKYECGGGHYTNMYEHMLAGPIFIVNHSFGLQHKIG